MGVTFINISISFATRMTNPLCLIMCWLYLLFSYCCCISEFAHDCISFLVRSEFVFINPNSKGQCGCGESFMTTASTGAAKQRWWLNLCLIKPLRNPLFYYSWANLSSNACLQKFRLQEQWRMKALASPEWSSHANMGFGVYILLWNWC